MTQLTESEHQAQMSDIAQFDKQMPYVGTFWYDAEEHNFFGVCNWSWTFRSPILVRL
jgi:hypothetical protein